MLTFLQVIVVLANNSCSPDIWFLYQSHERNLINISGQEKQRQQKKQKQNKLITF